MNDPSGRAVKFIHFRLAQRITDVKAQNTFYELSKQSAFEEDV